jgi:hypothetical protein
LGVAARTGATLIELNANVSSAVFQDLCLEANEPVAWEFFHHGRSSNTEIVQLTISEPTAWVGVTAPATPNYNSGPLSATFANGWLQRSGTWTGSHPAGAYRFAVDAIQGGSGPSYGNLLDDASVDLVALVEFVDQAGLNHTTVSEASGALVGFVINGELTAPTTIRLQQTAGSETDASDFALGTIADGNGAAIAGASAVVLPDGSIDVTVPPGLYWPNERSAYVQIPIILADAVNEPDETASFQLASSNPAIRPGDATCDGTAIAGRTFSIAAALDVALSLTTPDDPAEASDVVFTATVSNVGALNEPGPIEVRLAFSPAYNSLGGSGLGWSCSNNSTLLRCFFVNPLLPGETTPPLSVLTVITGSAGALAEVEGNAIVTGLESSLTNNRVVISGPVISGLPGTGIETNEGLISGSSLIAAGLALVLLARKLDLRARMLRRG